MKPVTIMRVSFLFVFVLALPCIFLLIRRRRNNAASPDEIDGFHPRIGFTRLDGMVSLSLLLSNESDSNVWAEEIEVFLTGLVANDQVAEPTCREIQKIRQMVVPRDVLPISLAEVIYRAAGEPQRRYSCVLSSVLRCRIGEKLIERKLENYRIQMAGLTASSIKRERSPVIPIRTQGPAKSREVPIVTARAK
jgi:hypothetical protein